MKCINQCLSLQQIFIKGLENQNRAIHEDTVAVEILPESEWTAQSAVLLEEPDRVDRAKRTDPLLPPGLDRTSAGAGATVSASSGAASAEVTTVKADEPSAQTELEDDELLLQERALAAAA